MASDNEDARKAAWTTSEASSIFETIPWGSVPWGSVAGLEHLKLKPRLASVGGRRGAGAFCCIAGNLETESRLAAGHQIYGWNAGKQGNP